MSLGRSRRLPINAVLLATVIIRRRVGNGLEPGRSPVFRAHDMICGDGCSDGDGGQGRRHAARMWGLRGDRLYLAWEPLLWWLRPKWLEPMPGGDQTDGTPVAAVGFRPETPGRLWRP